jgi:hypothetical protein
MVSETDRFLRMGVSTTTCWRKEGMEEERGCWYIGVLPEACHWRRRRRSEMSEVNDVFEVPRSTAIATVEHGSVPDEMSTVLRRRSGGTSDEAALDASCADWGC